jgi:molybdopterin molybdotransferase
MTTVAEHQAAVRALLKPLGGSVESLEVSAECMIEHPDRYRDRILALDVASPIDLPPFGNSQMDGYAVRSSELSAADAAAPVRRTVAATIAAGDPLSTLDPGTAAPIMTGAPIPAGADAVVPIERCDPPHFLHRGTDGESRDDARTVGFAAPIAPGTFVRAVGSDIRAGTVLLTAGTRLGPAQLGTLASAGIVTVPVRARIRVLVLSTGHELRAPGSKLASGQIYDANMNVLTAALQECGVIVSAVRLPDKPDEVLAALAASAADVDLVVTTGGVSAGAFEVVREALEPAGVGFGPVAMQPGGPQGLGTAKLSAENGRPAISVPVVAFPGNPVSTLVSFEVFLRPVLRALAGLRADRPVEHLPLADAVDSPPAKHQVRRGIVNDAGVVELVGGSSSHLLHSYALSSVLVHLPVGTAHVDAGDPVETWRIDD